MNSCCKIRNFRKYFESARKCASHTSTAETHEKSSVKLVKQLDLDTKVDTAVEAKEYHPRNHPGVSRSKADQLPGPIIRAMEVLTEAYKRSEIKTEGEKLQRQLWGRHLPPEEQDYYEKIKIEKEAVKSFLKGLDNYVDDDKSDEIEKKVVISRLKDKIHPWHPLSITTETCLQYFVSRTPGEFCVLHRIFSEIRNCDPDFVPLSLFDFGSGLASGYWAVKDVWKKPLMEVFNVDTNVNMNELAYKIMTEAGGRNSPATGIFFRQYLPAAPEPTYDLVLSAFTLLELPSFKKRMESIATLWSKTDKYLVIVEDGTMAGYQAVMEARNLILYLANESSAECKSDLNVHVVSPCPHDLICPQSLGGNTPCNFEVTYLTPAFLEGRQVRKSHRYSYVILKRGARPSDDLKWPRVMRDSTKGAKSMHLKLCTSNGTLDEITLYKQFNCKNAYQCAKRTRWGDRLPGQIVDKKKTDFSIRGKK